MRHGAAHGFILAVFLTLAFSASDLGAQAVRGRLLDMATGSPIVLGRMTLLDADGQTVAVRTTNTEGGFLLVAPEPGQYWVMIESPFHEGYSDGPISLARADTVSLTLEVNPRPVELDEIRVEGERRSPRLALEGVYDRSEARIGVHFDRERIRARPGGKVSDLVALLPMVELWPDTVFNRNELRVIFRRRQAERLIWPPPPPCFPQVFLNGMLLAAGGNVSAKLDQFSLNDLEAVEVFESPAGLPTRFHGQFARCGTIVLWSR